MLVSAKQRRLLLRCLAGVSVAYFVVGIFQLGGVASATTRLWIVNAIPALIAGIWLFCYEMIETVAVALRNISLPLSLLFSSTRVLQLTGACWGLIVVTIAAYWIFTGSDQAGMTLLYVIVASVVLVVVSFGAYAGADKLMDIFAERERKRLQSLRDHEG